MNTFIFQNVLKMKSLAAIFFFFICTSVKAQEFNDRIYLTSGDSIICKITSINGSWYNYDYLKKDKIKSSHEHESDVVKYKHDGVWKRKGEYTPKSYSDVVQVDSTVTKNELYSTFLDWIAKNYVSAQNVIQYQDKEEGKIVAKGNFKIYMNNPVGESVLVGRIHHTLSLYVKNGKFKYSIDNINFEGEGIYATSEVDIGDNIKFTVGTFRNQWSEVQAKSDYECKTTIAKLIWSAKNVKKSQDW